MAWHIFAEIVASCASTFKRFSSKKAIFCVVLCKILPKSVTRERGIAFPKKGNKGVNWNKGWM